MQTYHYLARCCALLFICFVLQPQAAATHFMGANIFYECVPNSNDCVYRVFHDSYYDCGGAATTPLPGPPFPPDRVYFRPDTCSQPLPVWAFWTFVSYVEVTPTCPAQATQCTDLNAVINGVLEARFYRDYDFCNANCDAYEITWTNCCRNGLITSGASNDGIFSKNTRIDLGLAVCNNSPYFRSAPLTYICAGTTAIYDQGAFDPDGDALRYRLIGCLDTDTALVAYNTGFSPLQPLGPSWQVSLDSLSGALSLLASPGGFANTVICIQVDEYRNGTKISSITRDMQVNVINCSGGNRAPELSPPTVLKGGSLVSPWEIEMCELDSLKFQISATDADRNDSVYISAIRAYPGLQIVDMPGDSGLATVSFLPPAFGSYRLPLLAEDDVCPLPGRGFNYVTVHAGAGCITAKVTGAVCGNPVGTIDLTIRKLKAPFTYRWSQGDTSQDINGLAQGVYRVDIQDSLGNVFHKSFVIDSFGISLNPGITQPSCNLPAGTIALALPGPNAIYDINWTNGSNLPVIAQVFPGGYGVTVSHNSGCRAHGAYQLVEPDSCFHVVEGVVFQDANQNQVFDAGEYPVPHAVIDLSPGGGLVADANGRYKFLLSAGSYDLRVVPQDRLQTTFPQSGSHAITLLGQNHSRSSLDFGMEADSVQDLVISTISSPVVPGEACKHILTVYNRGGQKQAVNIRWEYDSIFRFVSAQPAPFQLDTLSRQGRWLVLDLPPHGLINYEIYTRVDSTAGLGQPFIHKASAFPTVNDISPANNVYEETGTTQAADSAQRISVSPEGLGQAGLILQEDDSMTYSIHFQHTGLDTAFFVDITDVIDTSVLDIFSYQHLHASHPYQVKIAGDTALHFHFDAINFPDPAGTFVKKQGFVRFNLRHRRPLPLGSQIYNSAGISYDFSPEIRSDTSVNTIFAYPEIHLIDDTTLCEGSPVPAYLLAPGLPPYVFRWSDGTVDSANTSGQTQTLLGNSGTYQVQVTDALGITADAQVQLSSIPAPDASFTFVISGLTVTFTNTGTGNRVWFWNFGDKKTSASGGMQVHTYEEAGLYAVRLITSTPCGQDTVIQEVDLRTDGLADELTEEKVRIIPHPVENQSTCYFPNPGRDMYQMRIFDLTGKQVLTLPDTRTNSFLLSKASLPAGIYLYRLAGKRAYSGKLIIN